MRLKCWESKLAEQGLPEEKFQVNTQNLCTGHYGNLACRVTTSSQCCECCFCIPNLYDYTYSKNIKTERCN